MTQPGCAAPDYPWVKLKPLADDYDVEFWARQVRICAWVAVGISLLAAMRMAVAWESGMRWWAVPMGVATLVQAAATRLPWARIVRLPHAREALLIWFLAELAIIYLFEVVDDTGRMRYVPAVMLVVTAAAALYPPRWVIGVGVLALAGFFALVPMQSGVDVSFIAGMSAMLACVVGLCALTAGSRSRLDDRRRAAERRIELLLENSSDAVLAIDPAGRLRYVSPSARSLFGPDQPWQADGNLGALAHPDDLARAREWLNALAATPVGHTSRIEARLRCADDAWLYADIIGTNRVQDADLGALVLSVRDIGARRSLEEELTRQAFRDSLTGLANRALFRDRLEHAVARARRGGEHVTLLLIDLDNFKMVNDTLGHSAGDELLITVAERLTAQVRPADTLARLGGDEFALLVEGVDEREAVALAERVLAIVREPVHLAARDVVCTMSIGIATAAPSDGTADTEELLRDADLAMYASKRNGRDRYAVFDPAMYADVLREARVRAELERAVAEEQFFVLYQPIVDMPSGRPTGVEALVRWRHPTDGVLGPDTFIPYAEESGLIVPLGRWVLQQACNQLAQWRRELPSARHLHMSVNLSARQFQNPKLVEEVAGAVSRSGIEPSCLVLEITETTLLKDSEVVLEALHGLRRLGVRVAVDDFGSGYSSLGYLKRFPVDILKIDRSFVQGDQEDADAATLTEAVIGIGRALRLQTVAEGVETSAQWTTLRELGCDLGQGFYFARPAEADVIARLLAGDMPSVALLDVH
ncbi:putative bifunctional diguanylate cyclase/phosphodiesterase [Krasilnikovia sp. M28-CT-15]|uniref:putative bifunctional diguanylate cyclase/phosphodiesterase n=1 Tax=Krasilnikovia sp. M28-CT-15 TaxID=3373540 RepID=UPI0038763A9E